MTPLFSRVLKLCSQSRRHKEDFIFTIIFAVARRVDVVSMFRERIKGDRRWASRGFSISILIRSYEFGGCMLPLKAEDVKLIARMIGRVGRTCLTEWRTEAEDLKTCSRI